SAEDDRVIGAFPLPGVLAIRIDGGPGELRTVPNLEAHPARRGRQVPIERLAIFEREPRPSGMRPFSDVAEEDHALVLRFPSAGVERLLPVLSRPAVLDIDAPFGPVEESRLARRCLNSRRGDAPVQARGAFHKVSPVAREVAAADALEDVEEVLRRGM